MADLWQGPEYTSDSHFYNTENNHTENKNTENNKKNLVWSIFNQTLSSTYKMRSVEEEYTLVGTTFLLSPWNFATLLVQHSIIVSDVIRSHEDNDSNHKTWNILVYYSVTHYYMNMSMYKIICEDTL